MRRVFGRVAGFAPLGRGGRLGVLIDLEEEWRPPVHQRVAVFEVSEEAPVGNAERFSHLTYAQRRVVLSLIDLTEERGFAPTLLELADSLDLCKATVHAHLHNLKDAGVLDGGEGARTWRVHA